MAVNLGPPGRDREGTWKTGPDRLRASPLGRAVTVAVLLAACSPSSNRYVEVCPTGSRPANLRPAGTIVLNEGDSVRLGNPGATFVVAADGSLFFPDNASGQLVAFGRDAAFLGVAGPPPGLRR